MSEQEHHQRMLRAVAIGLSLGGLLTAMGVVWLALVLAALAIINAEVLPPDFTLSDYPKPQKPQSPIPAMKAKPWKPKINLSNSVKISAALLEQRLREAKKRDG